jgi:predicted nucleotidyltransferase
VKAESVGVESELLEQICREYGVAELSIFGSVVRGAAMGARDIDLLYILEPEVRLGWAIEDLSEELASAFGRPVDLVSKRALNPLHRRPQR